MRRFNLLVALFAAAAAAQLAVPAWTILSRERVLRTGSVYRFRTRPVDPYDAFRGRYVALAIEESAAPVPTNFSLPRRAWVYAALERRPDGFAGFSGASPVRPRTGDYLRVRAGYLGGGRLGLRLPFDRFYMEERLAPEAERAYREHSAGAKDAYVQVRVRGGRAVIEDLYIGDRPVAQFLREQAREPQRRP